MGGRGQGAEAELELGDPVKATWRDMNTERLLIKSSERQEMKEAIKAAPFQSVEWA